MWGRRVEEVERLTENLGLITEEQEGLLFGTNRGLGWRQV